jgi:hypothetical protein
VKTKCFQLDWGLESMVGHNVTSMSLSSSHFFVDFAVWMGALSCMKIESSSRTVEMFVQYHTIGPSGYSSSFGIGIIHCHQVGPPFPRKSCPKHLSYPVKPRYSLHCPLLGWFSTSTENPIRTLSFSSLNWAFVAPTYPFPHCLWKSAVHACLSIILA